MEIYDIVEAINSLSCKEIEGHYVLHRKMTVEPVRIYKKFSYVLYLIKGNTQERILTYQNVMRTPNIEIEKIWAEEDKKFLKVLLKWFKYGKLDDE